MKQQEFVIHTIIRTAWKTFLKYKWFLIAVAILVVATSRLIDSAMQRGEFLSSVWMFAIGIASILLSALISIGKIRISIDCLDGVLDPKKGFSYFLPSLPVLGRYILGSVIYTLIVCVGLVLFIVPGVILSLKYRFYGFNIIDGKMSVKEAFKESARMTKDMRWSILGFYMTTGIINLLGFLSLVIGLVVTLPVTALASAEAYRTLKQKSHIQTENS